jgi:hypothetical protein
MVPDEDKVWQTNHQRYLRSRSAWPARRTDPSPFRLNLVKFAMAVIGSSGTGNAYMASFEIEDINFDRNKTY